MAKPRMDDRRVLTRVVSVNRNGLRWRDASIIYEPRKTIYKSVEALSAVCPTRVMEGLAAADAEPKLVMMDATYL